MKRISTWLPPWVRPFCADSLFSRATQLRWSVALTGGLVLILAAQAHWPEDVTVAPLAFVAVLASGWIMRCTLIVGLLATAIGGNVLLMAAGDIDVVGAISRCVAFATVAGASRLGAMAWKYLRDSHQHELGTLLNLSHAVGGSFDIASMGAEAVRAAAGTVARPGLAGGRPAALIRIEGGRAILVAACDGAGVSLPVPADPDLGRPPAAILDTAATGRPAVVPCTCLLALSGADAWAAARVVVMGEPYGVLAVGSPHASEFRFDDLRLLDGIARVTGLALARAIRGAELVEVRRRLQHTVDLALEAGRSLDPAKVEEITLIRVAQSVGADRATLARMVGRDLIIDTIYWAGGGGRLVAGGRQFQADAIEAVPALARALASGQPVVAGALSAEPYGEDLATALADGRHTVVFPLIGADNMTWALVLSRHSDRAFGADDLVELELMADIALLALRNADLYTRAERAQRAKSAFLNLAAHELRTPLAVVKGYLSMLDDGTYEVPAETREEAVSILVAKAGELEALVEGLLTAARLDVGQIAASPAAIDAGEMVRQAIARVGPRAQLESARIEVCIPRRPVTAVADRGHVARILDNLLNNALTYSAGPAHVTVSVHEGDVVEIEVEDRGLGIAAEDRDHIFERFHRLDGASTRFSPGLGLGLSISRELAHANEGTLTLERSVLGEGSVFVLRLPGTSGLSARSA